MYLLYWPKVIHYLDPFGLHYWSYINSYYIINNILLYIIIHMIYNNILYYIIIYNNIFIPIHFLPSRWLWRWCWRRLPSRLRARLRRHRLRFASRWRSASGRSNWWVLDEGFEEGWKEGLEYVGIMDDHRMIWMIMDDHGWYGWYGWYGWSWSPGITGIGLEYVGMMDVW